MTKLSPQKELILSKLRDGRFHCQTEWLDRIKDDRKRISELNQTYMLERGYIIVGRKCDGRCGKTHTSGLYMRMARKRTPQDDVYCRNDEETPNTPQTNQTTRYGAYTRPQGQGKEHIQADEGS